MASTRVSGVRLENLLQQACEPLFWLNHDHKLIWVNRAWEELTGHPAESVLGLVCNAHGPTHAGDLAGLGGSFYPPAAARAGRPAGGPTLIIHSGGERKWRRVDYLPTHDGDGDAARLARRGRARRDADDRRRFRRPSGSGVSCSRCATGCTVVTDSIRSSAAVRRISACSSRSVPRPRRRSPC